MHSFQATDTEMTQKSIEKTVSPLIGTVLRYKRLGRVDVFSPYARRAFSLTGELATNLPITILSTHVSFFARNGQTRASAGSSAGS